MENKEAFVYMKLNEINIRDPYVLPYQGKYYMYGTRVGAPEEGNAWGKQEGFDVYISKDLEEWSEPVPVFEKNPQFWGTMHYWAPEVHLYNGKFYMLASFKSEDACRGTHILVADQPDGSFVPLTEEPATPKDWECLDGTLYIDKKGNPHMVFCHEWLQIGDGTVCEVELSKDLTTVVSEVRTLWKATDYPGVKSVSKRKEGYVTDGPFLYRCENDTLICIWSSLLDTGYSELAAVSDNGDIDGNWTVLSKPIYSEDGGHGMIFEDFEGNIRFVMHRPNTATLERPVFLDINIDENI